MAKSNMSFERFRFSVPKADVSVLTWITSQANLSQSIRTLIRNRIAECGMSDVTCDTVVQKGKVGRPSNLELAQREIMKEQSAQETLEAPEAEVQPKEQVKSSVVEPRHKAPNMNFPIVDGTQSVKQEPIDNNEELPDMLSMMGH